MYVTTPIQNWNQKWWQFYVTLNSTNSETMTGWVKTGSTKYTLNWLAVTWQDMVVIGSGYVALESRVGSYGDYWYDDFEIFW